MTTLKNQGGQDSLLKYDHPENWNMTTLRNQGGQDSTNIISLRAVRCKRKARREKFTHENCTLSTILLGPAGQRPAWA